MNHGDALRERLGLLKIVSSQQDGAAIIVKGTNCIPQQMARSYVESGRRFVEENDFGIAEEGESDAEPAMLATTEAAHLAHPEFFKTETGIKVIVGYRIGVVRAHERDDLTHPQVGRKCGDLRRRADAPPDVEIKGGAAEKPAVERKRRGAGHGAGHVGDAVVHHVVHPVGGLGEVGRA